MGRKDGVNEAKQVHGKRMRMDRKTDMDGASVSEDTGRLRRIMRK